MLHYYVLELKPNASVKAESYGFRSVQPSHLQPCKLACFAVVLVKPGSLLMLTHSPYPTGRIEGTFCSDRKFGSCHAGAGNSDVNMILSGS